MESRELKQFVAKNEAGRRLYCRREEAKVELFVRIFAQKAF